MIKNNKLSLKEQIIAFTSIVIFALSIFLSIDRYMLYVNIKEISDQCYDTNGFPILERSHHLSGNYSFSCDR